MKLTNYLVQRPPSGIYYVRWMVPVHARPVIRRSEFIKSLRTRDRAEAGRRALPILAEWWAKVDRATGKSPVLELVDQPPTPTDADLDSIVVDRGYEHIGGQLRNYVIEAAADGPEALSRLRQTFERTFKRYNACLIAKGRFRYLLPKPGTFELCFSC